MGTVTIREFRWLCVHETKQTLRNVAMNNLRDGTIRDTGLQVNTLGRYNNYKWTHTWKKVKAKKKFKNRYVPNSEPPKRHEAKLKGTEEMTNSKIIAIDFNIPLSVTDRIRNSASI